MMRAGASAWILGAALLASGMAGPAAAAALGMPAVLQSAAGDRVTLRLSGGHESDGPVTVCLRNRVANRHELGFDNRRASTPRYRAAPGRSVCSHFAPVGQSLYLWRQTPSGFVAVLSVPVNLRGSAGATLVLDWYEQGTRRP